jgi:hypothetical protein
MRAGPRWSTCAGLTQASIVISLLALAASMSLVAGPGVATRVGSLMANPTAVQLGCFVFHGQIQRRALAGRQVGEGAFAGDVGTDGLFPFGLCQVAICNVAGAGEVAAYWFRSASRVASSNGFCLASNCRIQSRRLSSISSGRLSCPHST